MHKSEAEVWQQRLLTKRVSDKQQLNQYRSFVLVLQAIKYVFYQHLHFVIFRAQPAKKKGDEIEVIFTVGRTLLIP